MLSIDEYNIVKEQAFANCPSKLEEICYVYPYTVREIIKMGSNVYNGKLGTLLLEENQIKSIIEKKLDKKISMEDVPDLFSFLIESAAVDDRFLLELQDIFFTFIKEDILILPELNCIVVGNPKEKRLITKENFQDLQTILKLQNRKTITPPPPPDETPGQRKMRILRERTKEAKRKQAEKNNETIPLFDLLEIAAIYGISLDNSLYAFYGLLSRHQKKEKWENDLALLCAGADSNKIKTQYWGESSQEE